MIPPILPADYLSQEARFIDELDSLTVSIRYRLNAGVSRDTVRQDLRQTLGMSIETLDSTHDELCFIIATLLVERAERLSNG